jgi:hypothetical protein
MYADVQEMIESYVQSNGTKTTIAFENVHFNAELYSEYLYCQVVFGEDQTQELATNCVRVPGVVLMGIHVRPGIGQARMLELVDDAITLFTRQILSATPPSSSPKVQTRVPTLSKDLRARTDWAVALVSCPFYFDTGS